MKNQFIIKLAITFLTALLLSVLLIGLNMLVIPATQDWSYFLFKDNLLILFLLSLAGLLMPTLYSKIAYFIFLFFIFLSEVFHYIYFKVPINPFAIWEFFKSFEEVGAVFFTIHYWQSAFFPVLLTFLLLIAVCLMLIYFEKRYLKIPYFSYIFLIGFLFFSSTFYWDKQKDRLGISSHLNLLRSGFEAVAAFNGFVIPAKLGWIGTNRKAIATPLPAYSNTDSANIILIMGESLNFTRMLLYTSQKDTIALQKLSKAYKGIQKLALSGGISTFSSLSRFFNLLEEPDNEKQIASANTSLFKLAKQNNFKTYFISAQTTASMSHIFPVIGAQYIDSMSAVKGDMKATHHTKEYDTILLTALKKINLHQGNNFVVLHNHAAHANYADRYPKDFKPNGVYKTDDYAKAVAYVEYVWGQILEQVAMHTTRPTHLIFTADHSQKTGENGLGHLSFDKEVVIVPFLYFYFGKTKNAVHDQVAAVPYLIDHTYISKLIARLLGYNYTLQVQNPYYVNGLDMNGLDGCWKLDMNDTAVVDAQILPSYPFVEQ